MPAETHMQGDPLGRDEILKLVRDRLGEILEVEPGSIQEGDSFRDDLDADSLALIELVEAIEEELSERSIDFRIDISASLNFPRFINIVARLEWDIA